MIAAPLYILTASGIFWELIFQVTIKMYYQVCQAVRAETLHF